MDGKTASALEKILSMKNKGQFDKALSKLTDLINKYPREPQLYIEAIDVCLEAGESLRAWKYYKQASAASPECYEQVWMFAQDKVQTLNDPVLAKLLIEQEIRKRELESSRQVVFNLENHTAKELLTRTRVKKTTLVSNLDEEYGLKGDLLVNIYSEALLLLRVGNTKEAMEAFVHILEEKPVENDTIEPFLMQLEKSMNDDSAIYFALGCCCLMSGNNRKAIAHFNRSIRINHAFLTEVIERIERIRSSDTPFPEDLELVLAEAYLMRADTGQAKPLLLGLLENQPARASLILDLTAHYMDEQPDLQFTYIEAAILSKQNNRASAQIRSLFEDEDRRDGLLDWLESKHADQLLPSDILLQYGKIALKQKLYDTAITVFTDAADMSPVDGLAICRFLEEHTENSEEIAALHDRLRNEIKPTGADTGAGTGEIEHFERSEFSLSGTVQEPSRPLDLSISSDSEPTTPLADAYFEREPEHLVSSNEPARSNPAPDLPPNVEPDLPLDLQPNGGPDLPPIEEPAVDADGAAQAAIELHYDRSETATAPPADEQPPAKPVESFDERYASFLEGCLEDEEIILLIDEAFTQGEHERLPGLLAFKPEGLEEEMQRKLHLTRFYLLQDQPLEALAVITSIAVDTVPRRAKKDFLLKLAACYRRVHLYEAAQSALLKLKCEHPDSAVINRLLQHNYSDYLSQQGSGAVTLEKTGQLD